MGLPRKAAPVAVSALVLVCAVLGALFAARRWPQPFSCPPDPPLFATVHCGRELTALRYYAPSHWDELRVYQSRPPGELWALEENEVQSVLRLDVWNTTTLYITRFASALAAELAPERRPPGAPPARVLLLGLGGGSAAVLLHRALGCHLPPVDAAGCSLELTGVDSSEDALAITRAHVLAEQGQRVRYVRADGSAFLRRRGPAYDCIFNDVYVGALAPGSTRDAAFARLCFGRLRPGGLYVVNVYEQDPGETHLRPLLAQLRALFGEESVWVLASDGAGEEPCEGEGAAGVNHLVFARRAD